MSTPPIAYRRSNHWKRFSHDLLPHLDKPTVRRAVVAGATTAGALWATPTPLKAEFSFPAFALRSIDRPDMIPLPNAVGVRGTVAPHFRDIDGDGDLDMAHGLPNCGGDIYTQWWENVGTPTAPSFVNPEHREGLEEVLLAEIAWADFDGDGDRDQAIFGESLFESSAYFENVGSEEEPEMVERTGEDNPLRGLGFVPLAAIDLTGDGYADLIDRNFGLHENLAGSSGLGFAQEAEKPFDLTGTANAPLEAMAFADLDGDGDYDAFVFEKDAHVEGQAQLQHQYYFENVGDASSPAFANPRPGLPTADHPHGILGGIPGSSASSIVMADVDGDGDFDAKVDRTTLRNIGSQEKPAFLADAMLDASDFPAPSSEVRLDLDGDGDLDTLKGNDEGRIEVLIHTGMTQKRSLQNPFSGFRFNHIPNLSAADIDHDGDTDLFVSDWSDQIFFFENLAQLSPERDQDGDQLPDAWEIFHFGDIDSWNASDDPDEDAMSNLLELVSGTYPNASDTDENGASDMSERLRGTLPLTVMMPGFEPQRASLPRDVRVGIEAISASAIQLTVTLPPATPVEVWHSTDLMNWKPVSTMMSGEHPVREIALPRNLSRKSGFYRIQMP